MPNDAAFQARYNALNSGQKQAVDTIEGPVMVLAGPGTGKTETLAMRIANILLTTQMDPWNILCLTFTESGVAAMRTRLMSIIGTPAYYVCIHTFHSFCNDIMKDHPELFATASGWQMLSDIERVELIRELIDALPAMSPLKPFGDPYLYMQDISSNIKQLKQEDISPDAFQELLKKIETFLRESREEASHFFSLAPKERTQQACEAAHEGMESQLRRAALPDSFSQMAERIYQSHDLEERTARTAFKNELKKWYERMEKQLPKQQHMAKIYAGYQKRMRKRGRYDYEDMVMMAVQELQNNDDLRVGYQEEFQYILVDEYQDTNGAQNDLVGLLTDYEQPNVFVVGDDKQSIYRFQGASLHNMLDFYEKHKDHVAIISLQENYRSQASILEAASAVIAHNKESIAKYIPNLSVDLAPAAGRAEEKLQYYEYDSENVEDYMVAKHVQRLLKEGAEPRDIAVLFRYHRDGEELFRIMQRLGIPARLEAGEDVLDNVCIQQMLVLLHYLIDMKREDLLARILQFDWLQLPALDVLKVVQHAGKSRTNLFSLLGDADALSAAGVGDPSRFADLQQRIADFRRISHNSTLQDFLHHVFTESGWLAFVLQQNDKLSCLQKMTRLLEEAKKLNQAQHTLGIEEFMKRLSLLQDHTIPLITEAWQTVENAVHLMTAHKAKGLEFEHVVITRLNNKHWGNNREVSKLTLPQGFIRYDYVIAGENNEDERRLFYVAMTRAKQTLRVTRAKHSASGRPTVPSIFLLEIPEHLREDHVHIEEEADTIERATDAEVKRLPAPHRDGIRAWLSYLLKDHVLSITHVNNYLECPRKFYIKNVLRVPSARNPHQALGSAVHAALEYFLAEYETKRSLPSLERLLEHFETFLHREVLTLPQADHALGVGRQMLTEYYKQYKDVFPMHTKREYDFSSHGVVIDGIPVTGLIDRIEPVDPKDVQQNGIWREGAKVHITDYKIGKPENGLRKLAPGGDYYRQLVFYKLLCDESPRFPFAFASAEVDFIQKSDRKGFVKQRVEVSDEEVRSLTQEIRQVWDQIQSLAFYEDGAGCGKDDCEFCN